MIRNLGIKNSRIICCLWVILQIAKISGDANTILDDDAERLSNATKHIGNVSMVAAFQDSDVKEAIKSALENNSVSEVVVRKNLLLFPLNAPNLVLSHRQEFHTIPEVHADRNKTGDNATYKELTEVNEFSLSQLISLNDSTTKGTGNEQVQGKDGILKAPKELKVISGLKFPDGIVTENIALPETLSKTISVPKESVLDLISTTQNTLFSTKDESIEKSEIGATVYKENYGKGDFVSPSEVGDSSSIKKIVQRSDDSFYNQDPTPLLNKLSPRSDSLKTSDSDQRKDFEDMEVAEDIVFRPLFRYRQETRVKPNHDDSYRRSSYITPRPYRYYETSYVPRKRYRPREYYNY